MTSMLMLISIETADVTHHWKTNTSRSVMQHCSGKSARPAYPSRMARNCRAIVTKSMKRYSHSLFVYYALLYCFELSSQLVQGGRQKRNGPQAQKYPLEHTSAGAQQNGSVFKTVGIIVQGPPVKGIFRDAECLVWALTAESPRANSKPDARISIFYTYNYALLDQVRTNP